MDNRDRVLTTLNRLKGAFKGWTFSGKCAGGRYWIQAIHEDSPFDPKDPDHAKRQWPIQSKWRAEPSEAARDVTDQIEASRRAKA